MIDTTLKSNKLVLEAKGIKKYFGQVRALDGVNLFLNSGEIHALLGDNGAGKSTLIKIISGVIEATHGEIFIEGYKSVFKSPREARALGIETVYQDLSLAHTLDASENIFLGSEIMCKGLKGIIGFIDKKEMCKQAIAEVRALGVEIPSWESEVGLLSGGQMQAVAIVRAVKWGSKVLILDEPTAALGAKQRQIVLDLIKKIRDEKNLAVLLISHNLPDVFSVADRVTVLRQGVNVICGELLNNFSPDDLIRAMTGAYLVSDFRKK